MTRGLINVDVGGIIGRLLERPWVVLIRTVLDVYGRAPGGLLANGLAFAALFATVPVALVTLGVAGWFVDDPAVQGRLARAIADIIPPLRELIDGALAAMTEGAALTSLLGVIGLIWTVSQFYVTLDVAFARIYSDPPERGVFRRTLRGFLWVAGLIGCVVALIVLGALIAVAGSLLPGPDSAARLLRDVLTSFPALVVMGVLVVLIIYRVVPPRQPSWRVAALPALIAGVGTVLLSQLFLYVAPRLLGATAIAGPVATAFVALAWLSFTFQVLLLGAAWVRVRDDRLAGSALASPAAAAESSVRGE